MAAAALLGWTLVFFLPVLGGAVFYFSDFHVVFVPLRRALGEALRSGFPLWTPLVGHGQPLAASPFAQALYPPNLLFALPLHPARVLTWIVLGHVAFGALGTFRLLRLQGLARVSAGLGALLFGFCGLNASGTHMVLLATTVAWTPWILAAQIDASRPGARSGAALRFAATLILSFLAGDPTMLASASLGCACFWLLSPLGGWRRRGRSLVGPVAGLLVAGTLVVPLLRAMRQTVAASVRATPWDERGATFWSTHPLETLGLVLPHPFGDPLDLGEGRWLAHGLHEGFTPLFPGMYVGLLAATLVAIGARARRARPAVVWLTAQLLLSMAAHLPAGARLLGLPGLSLTRYPSKWLLGAALPLAFLAAFGMQDLVARARSNLAARQFLRTALPALAASALVAIAAPLGLARVLAPAFTVSAAVSRGHVTGTADELTPALARRLTTAGLSGGAILAVGVLAATLLRRRRDERPLPVVMSALLAGDLLRENAGAAPTAPLAFYEREPEAAGLIRRDRPRDVRVYNEATESTLSVPLLPYPPEGTPIWPSRLARERLEVYSAACYGLSPVLQRDVERLRPILYEQLCGLVASSGERERVQLLSAAGVTHFVSLLPHAHPALVLLGELPSGAASPLRVYRNEAVLPRVRLVRSVVAFDGLGAAAEALRRGPDDLLERATLVPRSLVPRSLLPGSLDSSSPFQVVSVASPTDTRPASLSVLEDRPDRFVAETDGPGGVLVVSDAHAPGWLAFLDAQPAGLLPADVAFRGVLVPAGPHRVEMRYEPF